MMLTGRPQRFVLSELQPKDLVTLVQRTATKDVVNRRRSIEDLRVQT